VTAADVERLYRMLEKIDARIVDLEQEIAEKRGADDARRMSRGQVAMWAGVIIAGISVCTTILVHLTNTL
jgi:hypothetical protein